MLLKHNVHPRLIIQGLDPITFIERNVLADPEQLLPYLLFNWDLWNTDIAKMEFRTADFMVPLARYFSAKQAKVAAARIILSIPEKRIGRIRGYQPVVAEWDPKMKPRRPPHENVMDASLMKLFEKYLEECKESGIRVIMVYSPEVTDAKTPFVTNRDQVMMMYAKLAREHGVTYWDYTDSVISQNKQFFYDSIHMNKDGAEVFTADLIGRVKNEFPDGFVNSP